MRGTAGHARRSRSPRRPAPVARAGAATPAVAAARHRRQPRRHGAADAGRRRAGARDRGGEDGLPARHARARPRSRGRPRRRHREAGGDVRGGPRRPTTSRATKAQAARLPDARARDPVRARPPARIWPTGAGARRRPATRSAAAPATPAAATARRTMRCASGCSRSWPRRRATRPTCSTLDLDLEADLGVDTVKQAETFAAIRAGLRHPARREAQAARLPDARARHPVRARPRPDRARATRRRPSRGAGAASTERVLRRRERRGSRPAASTPPSACRAACPCRCCVPPLELCKATGVTLGAGSRVVVMADRGGVGQGARRAAREAGVEALVVDDAPASRRARASACEPGSRTGRSRASTGCRRSTPSRALERDGPRGAGARRCACA